MYINEEDFEFKNIKSQEFEELCFDLLLKMGFYNLAWRRGGPDNGRDIEATYTVSNSLMGNYEEKWFIECKNHSEGVQVTDLDTKFAWADAERPQHLLIIASPYVSNACRTWIEKRKDIVSYRVHLLEGANLKKILLNYQDLLEKFFVSKTEKLLKHTINGWLFLDILPSPKTIHYLKTNIDINKLSQWEISFLWNSYIHNNDIHFSTLKYNFDDIYKVLHNYTNCTNVIIEEDLCEVGVVSFGHVHQFPDDINCLYSKVVLKVDEHKYPALYGFTFSEESNTGIEVLTFQNERIKTKISVFKSNAYEANKEMQNLLLG